MPITPLHPVRRIPQDEFGRIAYEVMAHLFDIHNEFGRLFDEQIYKQELARRCAGVELEFPITVSHGSFSTTLFLDALIGAGGAFEFKAVEHLTSRHRGQLYNYLLLLDLAHGKLVNLRRESIEHEFVNAETRTAERHRCEIVTDRCNRLLPGCDLVTETVVSLLKDWGAGLALSLYDAALVHLLGGDERVLRRVSVLSRGRVAGSQPMRLAAEGVAFRLTTFRSPTRHFEDHARRLLGHVDLRAILWVNIGRHRVTFTTIEKEVGL